MTARLKSFSSVLACVALAACATVPATSDESAQASVNAGGVAVPKQAAPPIKNADAQVRELLGFFQSVSRLPAADQRAELVRTAQLFGREGTPYARVRLGGLHALPIAGLRDDARALALLEPLARAQPPEGALAGLASLLHGQVAERMRQLREDREARARLQKEEKEERQQLMREEARKQESLRERLEALKAIERSIMQREERSQSR